MCNVDLQKQAEQIASKLSVEEAVGQLLCYDIYDKDDPAEVEEIVKTIKPGGIFIAGMPAEKVKMYANMVNKYVSVPVIVSADVENGPAGGITNSGLLPYPMAWGASRDEQAVFEAGKLTARICRKSGIHWTFAPIVDLNVNFRSPETNIRAVSDDPDLVIKYAGAYSDGLRSEGLMITGAKHFPGSGVDERNSHFCITVNDLSAEEWWQTLGKVYKAMIQKGAESIMVGHYALPSLAAESEKDLPAIVCKSLLTDLLKKQLGFDGLIVSDALSMIGACAAISAEELCERFIDAGGDMVLFPEPTDYDRLLDAVKCGRIPSERFWDAVKRVITLKIKAGLFAAEPTIPQVSADEFASVAQKIADESITVIRDENKIVPLGLKNGDKLLVVITSEPYWHAEPTAEPYLPLKKQFESAGIAVDFAVNPKHKAVKEMIKTYDAVLVLCDISSKNYHGGTLRIGWYNIMTYWRGYILQHPKMVFASLGDPYKLFDFPYLKEYINVYSNTPESQTALAKVLCGQIHAVGESPVAFKGFFKRG